MDNQMMLKTTGLCKSYGKKEVLSNIDITINKGDIYGLVGRNGAGKTTIMRILTGLQMPTSGSIEYGFDNKRLGSIGSLVELPSIYSNKSAEENIKYQYLNLGLKFDDSIYKTLEFVGLHTTGKKPVSKFSLGMRQRLGIAMAIVGDPDLLILDEPINGLDPQGIIGVRNLLIKLNKEKGMTIVISSHILSELSKLATRYGFIDGGRIIREATESDVEHTSEKIMLLSADNFEVLCQKLVEEGYKAEVVSHPGKITLHGDANIADIAIFAKTNGFNITDIKTDDSDLENFYVGLVGGKQNG